MLDTIGHNHSGSLHRSALPAVPDILAIACAGRAWSADAALDVLLELTTSFYLDPAVARDDADEQQFKQSLLEAVSSRSDEVAQLAATAPRQQTR